MEAMREWTGYLMPLDRSDVDTDQIIPAEWLKRITRTGFGDGLFAQWREDPSFVLNDPARRAATILVARENFGVGSSREHAVWALMDWGFRVVIAPRFGDIFRQNATKNGLLPVLCEAEVVEELLEVAGRDPAVTASVSVEQGRIRVPAIGLDVEFPLEAAVRHRFVYGLDDIDLTLAASEQIDAFEARRPSWLPRLDVAL